LRNIYIGDFNEIIEFDEIFDPEKIFELEIEKISTKTVSLSMFKNLRNLKVGPGPSSKID